MLRPVAVDMGRVVMNYIAAAAGLCLLAATAPAAAYTIDFEDRGVGFAISQTFGQYRLSSTTSYWINTTSGSKAVQGVMMAPLILTRTDGAAFTLASADFFAGDGNGLGVPISFAFTRADGSTGNYTLQTPKFGPGAPIPSTRFFADFGSNLAGVTRISWSNGAEWHQVDNLVLDTAAAVPEPGT
jgi:hypothetical protein